MLYHTPPLESIIPPRIVHWVTHPTVSAKSIVSLLNDGCRPRLKTSKIGLEPQVTHICTKHPYEKVSIVAIINFLPSPNLGLLCSM